MFKFDKKLWNFRVRKTLVLALAVPLLSVMPQSAPSLALDIKPSPAAENSGPTENSNLVASKPEPRSVNAIASSNLIARYNPRDPSTISGSTWSGISGNGESASLISGLNVASQTIDGYTFNAMSFDGLNNHYASTTFPAWNFSSGFAISFYANFGNADNWERIIDFGNAAQSNNILLARAGTGNDIKLEIYDGIGSTVYSCYVPSGITNNNWTHWTFSLSNSACTIYKNGVSVTPTTSGTFKLPNTIVRSSSFIGKSNWPDALLNGAIADIAIYNSGLNQAQATDNFIAQTRPNVKFNANGGGGSPSASEIFQSSANAAITLATVGTLSRSGFTFAGWNTSANGTGTRYAAGSSYTPSTDVTLYAQWNSVINYNPNTATTTKAIESTTAISATSNTTLSNGKLTRGQPISSGLVLHLDGADPTTVSGSSWTNKVAGVSGAEAAATLVGSPTYNATEGAFVLNGSSQFFTLGTTNYLYNGALPFTLNLSFKASDPYRDNCLLGNFHGGVGATYMFRLYNGVLVSNRNVYPWEVYGSGVVRSGEIQYASYSFDGSYMRLYLNGALYATSSLINASVSYNGGARIGACMDSWSNSRFFKGNIYNAQIYNRALTGTEIATNYENLIPNRKVEKSEFTLLPWNANAQGTGNSFGATVTDIEAMPTPFTRLLPQNYNAGAKTWSNTNGSGSFTYKGTPVYNSSNGGKFGATGNFPTLSGGINDGIRLNHAEFPSYTLCAVARYKGGANATTGYQGRMLNSSNSNWFSGYYGGGVKQFHHTTWNINPAGTDLNWHYHCDSGNRVYWDGARIVSGWSNQYYTSLPPLAINWDPYSENSDWEIGEIIIYDQVLSDSQVEQINRYFKNRYGFVDNVTTSAGAASMLPPSNYTSTGDTTLNAVWGTTVTYDGNGQTSGSAPTPTIISGASGNLASNSGALSRAGWRFDGWNTAANGTGTNYAAGASYPNSGNVILYAKWTLVTVFPTAVSYIEPNNLSPYMRFKASDYDATNKVWRDSSGNSRNTSLIGGTPSVVTTTANSDGASKAFQVVQGNTSANIRFGNPRWDGSRYTLFTVARYSGASKARIFDGVGTNWLHGFWNGYSGVAHHNAWVTQYAATTHGSNWVLGTSYAYNYRSNGTSRGTSGGDANFYPLSINYEREASDFQVAEVLIFDRQLTLSEIQKVEDYLAFTYGLNPPATTTNGYTQVGTYTTNSVLNVAAGVGGRTDTFTAINGLGNKTFTMTPVVNGITLDTTTANAVSVNVSGLVPAGTYIETITATDQSGATSIHLLTINAASPIKWSTANATSVTTTVGTSRSVRLDITGGTTGKVATLIKSGSLPLPGITIDTSTLASSSYVTLNIGTNVLPGTHTLTVNITDATGLKSNQVINVAVNKLPALAFTNGVSDTSTTISKSGLWLQYEIGKSWSGTGTSMVDLTGNNASGSITANTTYSSSLGGGSASLNGTNMIWLNTSTILSTDSLSKFYWIYPTSATGTIVKTCNIGCGYEESEFEMVNGKLYARVWDLARVASIETITINAWHYVGYVYDRNSGNTFIYVDGQVAGSIANSGTRGPPSTTQYDGISIGATRNTMLTSANLAMSFGAAHYYKRVLSAAEVFANYAASAPRYLGTAFPGLSISGSATIATTQGVTSSHSLFTATNGTGGKVITLSPTTSGITLDTSTANSAILNIDNTLTATNSTTQKVIQVSVVATDSVTAVTTYPLAIQVNPPISLVPTTANSISTTFGVPAYDTFTAAYGTGTLSFNNVASAYQSAFVFVKQSANVGLLTISGSLPAGTYTDTLTVTDAVGAVARHVLTVVVNPGMTLTGATSSSIATTIGKSASLRVNIANGTGTRTMTMSATNAGITLNAATIADGYVTINVGTNVPANTYSITLTARDSKGSTATGVFTVVVNKAPKIAGPTVVTNGLALNFDAANPASYSGSGTTWNSTVGGNSVTLLGTSGLPTYSSDSGGLIDFNPTNLSTQKHYAAGTIANTTFSSYTVEAWAKFAVLPTGEINALVSDKYQSKINYELFYGSINTENCGGAAGLHISHYDGSWRCSKAVTGIATNTWYHIVGTYDSGVGFKMYLNGVLQSGATVNRTGNALSDSSNRQIYIAKRHDASDQFFPGSIPVVRIYNRALSATEALQNYTAIAHRYVNAASGNEAITVTSGKSGSVTGILASDGTGNKTFALSGANSGITINTATPNQYTLTLGESLTSTNSTTARTIYETVTATDSVTATTTLGYTITVNPPIQVAVSTSSLTTTSGIAAYDTFTATYGTGNKTFALTGSPTTSGFTLTQANNIALLKVEPTANPGTYYETVTATDSVGAIKSQMITVVVNPRPTISGVDTLTATAGYVFNSPAYSAASGTGTLTYSITAASGITLVQNLSAVSIRMADTVASGTYFVVVRVTDSLTAFTTKNVTLVVNQPVTLSGDKTLSKVYGEDLAQVYQTSSGTAPFSIFTSSVCTSEKFTFTGDGTNGTTNGVSYTAERFNGVGNCNWKVPNGVTAVSALTVGGGGGGGGTAWAGGGGAGGVVYVPTYSVTPNQTIAVVVGAGGAGGLNDSACTNGNSTSVGSNGSASSFNGTYVANGGGGGGGYGWDNRLGCGSGRNGGNGGGFGETNYAASSYSSQTGISNQSSYAGATSYGNNGGVTTYLGGIQAGSGGGGAGGAGGSTSAIERSHAGGNGGPGIANSITGTSITYAGGGGGATCDGGCGGPQTYGAGGIGGGGNGGLNSVSPVAGTNGLGGGGGGSQTGLGAKGGSGTVIVRYVTPDVDSMTTSLTMTTLSTNSPGAVRLNSPKNMQVGTYTQTITVTDANGSTGSTPVTVTLTITKATPTVALSLPGLVSVAKYGTPVSITATASTPGRIAFKLGNDAISGCESVTATNGVASCTWTPTSMGSKILKATLTPTDTTNYNNSAETPFSITVIKADALTVTALDEVFTYTGNPALVSKPFTFNNLLSIDTLTAVSMLYTGTANDGTVYSSTTAPTLAGTYTITPNYPSDAQSITYQNIDSSIASRVCRLVPPGVIQCTGGAPVISDYYETITVVSGTLRIDRRQGSVNLAYNNDTNIVTYAPSGTHSPSTVSRDGTGVGSISTTTALTCSIDTQTAVVTVLAAGDCGLTIDVAQDPNYLAASTSIILEIEKAPRTIALTSPVSTLKYFETTTVTTVLSGGDNDGVISFTLNSNPGCSFDSFGGILTATSGTLACTLNATIDEGNNYLTASTTSALSMTMAKADAPLITIDTVTAVDYVPGQNAQIVPTYTISGLKGSDAGTVTLNYTLISTAAGFGSSYSSTTIPEEAGTYGITPSALTLSSGLVSNYETPNYSSSLIRFTINRINQAAITIDNVNGEVDVPFRMFARGGTTNGALTFTKISGETCSVSGNELNATTAGSCVVTVTMAENRNYLPVTSESVTVIVRRFVLTPTFIFGNGSTGISLGSSITLTKDEDICLSGCVPTITTVAPYEGAEGDVITLTGTNFTGVTQVVFNVFTAATVFAADSDTQITVQVPGGLTVGDGTIEVKTPRGVSPRYFDFYVLP